MSVDRMPNGPINGTYKYILVLDIGSTVMNGHVYDNLGRIQGTSAKKIVSICPSPAAYEIEPESLYDTIVVLIKETIKAAGLSPYQVTCMGIATQRNTFTTWDRETGKPYHNFISWMDRRCLDITRKWNNSYTLKVVHGGAKFIHALTRNAKFRGLGSFLFDPMHVSMRLLWVLKHIPNLRQRVLDKHVMFGCMETWLVYKLTQGQVFATDYSCASTTGLYDPFELRWSNDLFKLLNIPSQLQLPEVRDTSGDYGYCDQKLFGAPIPIKAVIGDQQSAMFGQCCFDEGDLKCTMGTGTFIDVNTGSNYHVSDQGLVSTIAWKIGDNTTYLTEGCISDTGISIEWAHRVGFIDEISKCSQLAESVTDSGGVSFISSFGGLQVPITDSSATTTIIGATSHTSKAHIVRAILESCAFRYKLLYDTFYNEIKVPFAAVRIDGGVSQNDFLVQLMSDFCGKSLERSQDSDMTSLGAAFLAGLATGIWKSHDELRYLRQVTRVFTPNSTRWINYKDCFTQWMKAVKRAQHWYSENGL